ncbi:hypothetical protein PanWU01x14_334650 [Parasponia andersonii]|uniref:Uncharacterized protein n=1 Tax=Parasponia andersonii TaxID=3476 RepID=A0A2P5AGG0_PARAD|nr:hypothetical protein PanWU01x14_334650 [Parasponia andersonii]
MELVLPKHESQGLSFLLGGLCAAQPRGFELKVSFMGLKVDIRFNLLPLWK